MTAPVPRHKIPAQRRLEILRAVRSGSTHVTDLAQSFGVSEMTVRRDLSALARDGKLERVHGGAVNARVGITCTGATSPSSRRASRCTRS